MLVVTQNCEKKNVLQVFVFVIFSPFALKRLLKRDSKIEMIKINVFRNLGKIFHGKEIIFALITKNLSDIERF